MEYVWNLNVKNNYELELIFLFLQNLKDQNMTINMLN